GLATARMLAAEGARVAIASRTRATIEQAAADIGERAMAFVCDMTDRAARAALCGAVESSLGPIDILVINSGGPAAGPLEAHADEAYAAALDEHLGGAVALTRCVLPGMRARRWGRILTITSCSVKQPIENMMLSTVARAAVVAFARTCANEVAADGITVNNLMPGYTLTARISQLAGMIAGRTGQSEREVIASWEADIPARRLGTPEEFAATATFLCSVPASYINGVSLSVDGGWNRSLF
ncbi:MAG: SDR family oxidoreductase, partial [Rhodanobacter sp.]